MISKLHLALSMRGGGAAGRGQGEKRVRRNSQTLQIMNIIINLKLEEIVSPYPEEMDSTAMQGPESQSRFPDLF